MTIALLVPSAALAHPHGWIDVRSTVVLDENGLMVALEQDWLFDDYYTAFVLSDLKASEQERRDQLRELARINLGNLKAYDYFLEIRAAGAIVAQGTVAEFDSALRGNRLWLRFTLPLAKPVDPRVDAVSFSVFDPTYYVEMLHEQGSEVAIRNGGGCAARILPPTPTAEAVMLARSLDRNATPNHTLGSLFAERVEIACK